MYVLIIAFNGKAYSLGMFKMTTAGACNVILSHNITAMMLEVEMKMKS